ncbi:nuclear transport factor 2 family protein [Erythrobacter sp. SCSIO 43205]|uniref:nuclear transport factor 2 family protein n=1 Tax=Erythrobacter sp. SCSIO 43205 TaxID=2779361 RepID=UPI001CA8C29F|nr:nuclear transport factor 2 family protein [Erythrobacter sp. SCSIO 43205]UAB77715.1 nuclear transport factor 2 family protein [Erythrobacter sp. SCSIO 43205]
MDNIKIARLFFTSLEVADLETARSLCADGFRGTQNGGVPMDADTLMGFTDRVHKVVPDFRYENTVCQATENGFIEEHDVCGTLPDESTFKLTLCVVGEVEDGKIAALREYVDTGAAAGLMKALRPD